MTSARLRWNDLYSEVELYRAALRVYTKPLFAWRKAAARSTDDRTLYDFARHGIRNIDQIHRALAAGAFKFRPGVARHYNFNGRLRILYIYPWEERIVDLLLYRLLDRRLHRRFSPHSYAYRLSGGGVDLCQSRIARLLALSDRPKYIVKRDIADYFASISHPILLEQVGVLIAPDDYLLQLLRERIEFPYVDGGILRHAERGIPFGTPIACLLANIHLTELDRELSSIDGLRSFRYADDFLMIADRREAAVEAASRFDAALERLRLTTKPSHRRDMLFATAAVADAGFPWASKFKHLGLEFRADGSVGLSRDKFRKIRNIFKRAFKRDVKRLARTKDPVKRARALIDRSNLAIDEGFRNVAIIDYYLKHVTDERQLRLLDRWLAEEVLAMTFGGGHKKGNFRKMPYEEMRRMGLPSLVHRRRLILHGHLESPFFIWKNRMIEKGSRGAAARRKISVFSPSPEATAVESW